MPSLLSLLGWNLEVENWSKCPRVFEEAENTVVMADEAEVCELKKNPQPKISVCFFLSVDWLIFGVLDLHRCMGFSLAVVSQLLIAVASLVAEHGL